MESEILKAHLPCPDCGSSDALCEYTDGHTFCFSCETWHGGDGSLSPTKAYRLAKDVLPPDDMVLEALPARLIKEETCRRFGYYKAVVHGKKAQVANYIDDNGVIIGQKLRYANKEFEVKGKLEDRFFGQHLYPSGCNSKYKLVITEGEIDALTVSQVQGNKFPVVSLPNGAGSAKRTFKAQFDWLETWEEVVLMFDMDKVGQEAVKEVAGMLSPHKVKIAKLPCKDANECLLEGKADAIVNAIWNAAPYRPECIINGSDLWERLSTEEEEADSYPLPWDIPLQDMTQGLRKGELVVITAGTGTGKTTFVRQIAHWLGVKQNAKIGMLMLEENVKRTAKGIMSVHVGKRLALNRNLISPDDYQKAFMETLGTGNFTFYEHFGSLESEKLLHNMRFLAVGEQCDFIILDHISIAISGLDIENERKATDVLMTRMRELVEETGVGMIVISHLKRVEGTPAEEGGAISLSHLRGSQAIAQLSDGIWALERNQQGKGNNKNCIRVRVLKGRHTGETGIAGYLEYDKESDRLFEAEASDFMNAEEEFENGKVDF